MTHSCNQRPDLLGGASTTSVQVQDGWTQDGRRIMRTHKTEWLPMACGHDARAEDPNCRHCERAQK